MIGRRDERTPAGHLTVPFNAIDEAFFNAPSSDAPFSDELEVRVVSHLDERRLRGAVAHALRTHPMARARMAPWSPLQRSYRWEIVDHLDVDPVLTSVCADDADLQLCRDELYSAVVPLDRAPPFRLLLARHPAGDALMLTVPHAAADLTGALRLMRSIARAYAGDPDPVPPLDPLRARALDDLFSSSWSSDWLVRARALQQAQREAWLAPPARLAPEGGAARPGYGVHHVTLPADAVALLRPKRFVAGTVNDLLLAALSSAIARWNEAHGVSSERIALMVPVNLRPAAWRHEVVGNFSLAAGVSTGSRSRADPPELVRCIVAQTTHIKANLQAAVMIDVLRPVPWIPIFWKQSGADLFQAWTGDRFVPTATLTNVGRLGEPYSFGSDGQSTGVWLSPPCQMPMGLGIGAVSCDGAMHLSFRYRHPQMSAAAARRFADLFVESLETLG